jgi:hypothetical protein
MIRIMGHSGFGTCAPAKAKSDEANFWITFEYPFFPLRTQPTHGRALRRKLNRDHSQISRFALGASRKEPMRQLCVTLENPFFNQCKRARVAASKRNPARLRVFATLHSHTPPDCWLAL